MLNFYIFEKIYIKLKKKKPKKLNKFYFYLKIIKIKRSYKNEIRKKKKKSN